MRAPWTSATPAASGAAAPAVALNVRCSRLSAMTRPGSRAQKISGVCAPLAFLGRGGAASVHRREGLLDEGARLLRGRLRDPPPADAGRVEPQLPVPPPARPPCLPGSSPPLVEFPREGVQVMDGARLFRDDSVAEVGPVAELVHPPAVDLRRLEHPVAPRARHDRTGLQQPRRVYGRETD